MLCLEQAFSLVVKRGGQLPSERLVWRPVLAPGSVSLSVQSPGGSGKSSSSWGPATQSGKPRLCTWPLASTLRLGTEKITSRWEPFLFIFYLFETNKKKSKKGVLYAGIVPQWVKLLPCMDTGLRPNCSISDPASYLHAWEKYQKMMNQVLVSLSPREILKKLQAPGCSLTCQDFAAN